MPMALTFRGQIILLQAWVSAHDGTLQYQFLQSSTARVYNMVAQFWNELNVQAWDFV